MNSPLVQNSDQLDQQLEQFDFACEKLKSIQFARESAQEDLSKIHDDLEIPAADRAKKSVSLRSLVDVLVSDEARQQADVDARRKQVLAVADELFNVAGGELSGAIHNQCEQHLNALREQFDVNGVHGLEEMVKSSRLVRPLLEAQGGVSIYRSLRDPDERLARARQFRTDVLAKLS